MIARRMGKELIDQNLVRFGFGRPAELGFPFEAPGKWLVPRRWTGTSIGTIPIGQGVTVTALQMVAAFNALANDGVWVAPRLQRGWVDAAGRRHEDRPVAGHEVVSPTTARAVRGLLADVVKDGSGRNAAVLGYQVAGKTGTARKAIGGQYVKGAYVSSFAGMFPASSPKLSMIVTIDEPRTDIYASTVAAPLFGEITRMAAQRYRIAPASADVALNVRAPQWSAALADAQAARREATLADAARQQQTARPGRTTTGTGDGTSTADASGTVAASGTVEAADTGPTTAARAGGEETAVVRAAAANRSGGTGGEGATVAGTDRQGEDQSPAEPVTPRRRVASWPPTSAVASQDDGPAAPVRPAATGRSSATRNGQPVTAARTATQVEDAGP
jgi:membrane peptidoglycan carboxypeptidase